MTLKHILHTGFIVEDLQRSLSFYRDLLGFSVERERTIKDDELACQLFGFKEVHVLMAFVGLGGNHRLELLQFVKPMSGIAKIENNDVGATHLAIAVDDIRTIAHRLAEAGINFRAMPTVERQNAVYPWARRGCYVQDPDGNWLELLEIPEEQ